MVRTKLRSGLGLRMVTRLREVTEKKEGHLEAIPVLLMIIPHAEFHGAGVAVNLHGPAGVGEPDPGILHAGELDEGESPGLPGLLVLGNPDILEAGATGSQSGPQLRKNREWIHQREKRRERERVKEI